MFQNKKDDFDQLQEIMSKTDISSSETPTSSSSSSMSSDSTSPASSVQTPMLKEEAEVYKGHLKLLSRSDGQQSISDMSTAPIFATKVLEHVKANLPKNSELPFAQYGLLAGEVDRIDKLIESDRTHPTKEKDPRLFVNITTPSSIFICGSQGSGKSHTLSCLLENSLAATSVNNLPRPLTGLVFHYDTFISDDGGSPCEAAFLSTNNDIKVRVLCAPTNMTTIKKSYYQFKNIQIEPLKINQSDLNTKRMLDLMGVSSSEGSTPLYIHTVQRILRQMRMDQQKNGSTFDYKLFKEQIEAAGLSPMQLIPLQQRLDVLESFMPNSHTDRPAKNKGFGKKIKDLGNDWTPEAGCLTIVDLSCPCVTPESACSLFNICLSIFLANTTNIGRVVALDEAHKYMNSSTQAASFTESLLATIRLQRHLGARIIISTQEPTISPALLDLSSVTIVHRFTSPEWFRSLERHLAGAASKLLHQDEGEQLDQDDNTSIAQRIFREVVKLEVGEAILFSPSAALGIKSTARTTDDPLKRLGTGFVKILVRSRLTMDGGKSVMAN